MADLFTHAATAVLVRLPQPWRVGILTFVAGSCLPDISRVPAMVFTRLRYDLPAIPEWLCYVWAPLHMPVGIVLQAYAVSLLFAESRRRLAFRELSLGGLFHLFVDMFQHHFGMGYLLLFPFSSWDYEFGLIGSEATVPFVPVLVPLVAFGAWSRWGRNRPVGA